jgi:hypothetical protein
MGILLTTALCGLLSLPIAQDAATSATGDAPPEPTESAPVPGSIETVDDLLGALERTSVDMGSLRAQISYTREFLVAGDRQVRLGTVVYESIAGEDGAQARRRFGVHFDRLVVDRRVQEDRQTFIFDGEWYLEKRYEEKWCHKQQIVAPGERFDPLRIGEGPFPIPLGQRRADILARFDAELLPKLEGLDNATEIAFIEGSGDAYQLKLTPRTDLGAEGDFEEVRLWYGADEDGELMPVLARRIDHDGDIITVALLGVEKNIEIDPALLDTTVPARGWDVKISPYRESTGPGGPGGGGLLGPMGGG